MTSMKAWTTRVLWSFLLFLCLAAIPSTVAAESAWTEIRGTHFLIYSRTGVTSQFKDEVLRKSEEHYRRMIRYFGNFSDSGFWLWDKRCKIFIYDSKERYLKDSKQPVWSGGYAVPEKRTIVSYQDAPNFLVSILPHEMAHLIFRDFVGYRNREIPVWLDEGFAVWQEQGDKSLYEKTVYDAVVSMRIIPIESLSRLTRLHNYQTVDAQLFYAESQSIVAFLIDGRDTSYFTNLCRDLKSGMFIHDALVKNFRQEFDTISELEEKWKNFVIRRNT